MSCNVPDLSRWPGARWRARAPGDNHPAYRATTTGFVHVDITLRRIADGVERIHVDNVGWQTEDADAEPAIESAHYWWTEGNGGCDCNRRLFFLRAGGDQIPETDECTHGEYAIVFPPWLADPRTW